MSSAPDRFIRALQRVLCDAGRRRQVVGVRAISDRQWPGNRVRADLGVLRCYCARVLTVRVLLTRAAPWHEAPALWHP